MRVTVVTAGVLAVSNVAVGFVVGLGLAYLARVLAHRDKLLCACQEPLAGGRGT